MSVDKLSNVLNTLTNEFKNLEEENKKLKETIIKLENKLKKVKEVVCSTVEVDDNSIPRSSSPKLDLKTIDLYKYKKQKQIITDIQQRLYEPLSSSDYPEFEKAKMIWDIITKEMNSGVQFLSQENIIKSLPSTISSQDLINFLKIVPNNYDSDGIYYKKRIVPLRGYLIIRP